MTMKHATKIVIKSGTIVQHIDPVMPPGGVIAGTVRAVGPGGKRLRGICVFAEGHSFAETITGRSGNYRLVGLTTGKYRVFYSRCRNQGMPFDTALGQDYGGPHGVGLRCVPAPRRDRHRRGYR